MHSDRHIDVLFEPLADKDRRGEHRSGGKGVGRQPSVAGALGRSVADEHPSTTPALRRDVPDGQILRERRASSICQSGEKP